MSAGLIVFLLMGAPTIGDVEQMEAQARGTEALKEFRVLGEELLQVVEKTQRKFLTDCLRAFGHKGFCVCISFESPANTTLAEYVVATTTDSQEMGYRSRVREARESCVRHVGFP